MPRHDTEPYERLISEEEVELARPAGKDHQRNKQRGYQQKPPEPAHDWPKGPACDFAEETPDLAHPGDSMSLVQFMKSFVSDRVPVTQGYRLTMTTAVTILFLIAGAAYGVYERFGVSGFARSDVIKSKIEAATKPLEQELVKQTALLNSVAAQLTNQLASSTATQIRSKLERLCAEPKPSKADRDQLNQDIADLQDEYFDLKLMPYTPPPCSQL
jgi:hypothetical protein